MNDKDIDHLIDSAFDQPVPEPDQDAKNKAINIAKNAFNENFSQGYEASARPIDSQSLNRNKNHWGSQISILSKSIRSLLMNFFNNKTAYNAFGTAAIAFVAVSMVYVMPSMQTDTKRDELVDLVITEQDEVANSTSVASRDKDRDATNDALVEEVVITGVREEQAAADKNYQDIAHEPQPQVKQAAEQRINEAKIDRVLEEVRTGSLQKTKVASSAGDSLAGKAVELEESLSSESTVASARSKSQLQTLGATPTKPADGSKRKRKSKESFFDSRVAGIIAPSPVPVDVLPNAPAPRLDDGEEYAEYSTNPIIQVSDQAVSTFSIDVDTASYSLVRNQLQSGRLPKPQAVRAEELINYFDYDYVGPKSKKRPFQPSLSVIDSPWNADRKLVHIGIKGYNISKSKMPDSNIVFLLDVSGSMNSANKLPLVKQSLGLLLKSLKPSDKVSIVVYAGAAGTVLEPTEVKDNAKIMQALQRLNAGGSTAGGAGISLAYQLAEQNFNKEGVNRIILATDGDFNVGQSSNEDLKTLVERKRESGIFLSILGFGRNNYQDDMMQTLAQNGNGVAAYIDSLSEAKKVLVDEATSTLFPIAKDVKIQVEFNPAMVSEYRLVGYETRALQREDFNNDKVDAGDIGAGHTVTAIYEITPAAAKFKSIDEPRYAANRSKVTPIPAGNEYGFLKIRYKLPNGKKSVLIEQPIISTSETTVEASNEVEFSIAVAGFAQLLSNPKYVGDLSYDDVIKAALANKGKDPFGYRSEFIQLARMAQIARP